jgi:hypothetical protein
MKPILIIIALVSAFIFYACSPSNYKGKKAVSNLENNINQSVIADTDSALGYSVTVGDSHSQYYRVKCGRNELLRLVDLLELTSSYTDYPTGANVPKWLKEPSSVSGIYGRANFRDVDYGSCLRMWHLDDYLFVSVSFWH